MSRRRPTAPAPLTAATPPSAARARLFAGCIEPRPTLDESEQRLAERIARDPLMVEDPPQATGVAPGASSFDGRRGLRVRLADDEPG